MNEPDDQREDAAPGWEAIDRAVRPLYPDQEPRHVGTLISWRLGGPDPLDGISAWKRTNPVPHWHYVTYGFSELYGKDSEDPDISGYGFELTFRLACDPLGDDPPTWPFSFLQNLARYVFKTGNLFGDGQWMSANGPIAVGADTLIHSLGLVFDPELPAIDTVHGRVEFLQVVGLTSDEENAAKQWQTRKLLEAMVPAMPLWITDLSRASLLDRPEIRAQVDTGTARDGSSTGLLFTEVLEWSLKKRFLGPMIATITLGAGQVDALADLLMLRLPFERELRMIGGGVAVAFAPAGENRFIEQDRTLRLELTADTARMLTQTLKPRAGSYCVPGLDTVRWEVRQTFIRDGQGNVVETIG